MGLFLTVCLEVRYILKMVERALQAIGLGSQMEFVRLILTVMKRHKATGITSNLQFQRIFSFGIRPKKKRVGGIAATQPGCDKAQLNK